MSESAFLPSPLPLACNALWPGGAAGGHVGQLLDGACSCHSLATRLCLRKACRVHQTPHALLLAPQLRRPVRTATSPVTTATASPSGGSVMERRSVPMALTSRRPLAVSPVPWTSGVGVAVNLFPHQLFCVGSRWGSSEVSSRTLPCPGVGPQQPSGSSC